jgi:hypothetical protein
VAGGEAEAEGLEVARLLAVVLTLHRGRPLQPPASILPAHLQSWRAAIESVQLANAQGEQLHRHSCTHSAAAHIAQLVSACQPTHWG